MRPIVPLQLLVAALTLAGCAACAVLGGCGGSDQRVFTTASDERGDRNRSEIQKEIAALANAKDPRDVEKDLVADDAKDKLIRRGSAIEPQLIEALGGSDDWAVRLGVIQVLEAVGTKGCVDAVVRATGDEHALVALEANSLLEVMCDHREIPAPGEAAGANNVPPFDGPAAGDQALDARERSWTAWHAEHRQQLQRAWSTWWSTHRDAVKIH